MRVVMMQYLAIGAAGFLGAICRYFVASGCARAFGTGFPIGTFIVNISGCVAIGWLSVVLSERLALSETMRLALAVGFLGSYTTFSTFIFESGSLLENGSMLKAIINLVGSLIVGLIALRLGMALAMRT